MIERGLESGSMIGNIHHFRRLSSTQDAARRLLAEGAAREWDVVVADEQTSGRGRFGREWASPVGGLYATFIIMNHPLIPVHAGVSIVAALDRFGLKTGIKWPNDIVIGGAKLGGVIVETAGEIALLGIGINLRRAPLPASTCAARHGVNIDRGPLLDAISAGLAKGWESDRLLDAYRARSATIGLPVSVERGKRSIIGIARGIDRIGRLLVETEGGIQPVASGECSHLRQPAVDSGRSARLS